MRLRVGSQVIFHKAIRFLMGMNCELIRLAVEQSNLKMV
jgi:hypothetical protein